MAIHVPMSEAAINEAKELMMANKNILSPKDGDPIINPSQDMILGLYYISKEKIGAKGEGQYFASFETMMRAYEAGELELHAKIAISINGLKDKFRTSLAKSGYIISTVGKFIFNDDLPVRFPFIFGPQYINEKNIPAEFFVASGKNIIEAIKKTPFNKPFTKSDIAKIIRNIFDQYSPIITKRDLAKIVQKINSGVMNDVLGFITKICKTNKITLNSLHALYIQEFLTSEFMRIRNKIKFSNGGVDRTFEVSERISLLDNV
jgi:DNA-directed RNA polymerase subunit beta'